MRQLARLGRGALAAISGAACVLAAATGAAEGQQVSAAARIEKKELFLGESLVFQIHVQGDDKPGKPDLSTLTDFRVRELGGQTRNSESVTIINGRVSRVVRKGYVFSYRLTPTRAGQLAIPALQVAAGGRQLRTRPVEITVRQPAETEDFKLRLALSKAVCHVGEPVTLTVTWYLGKDVRGFQFLLPVLQEKTFRFHDPEMEIDSSKRYYRVTLGDGEVIAQKGQGTLEGRAYATLSFRKVLIPTRPGRYPIRPATAAFDALVGYRKSRDFFDDFFSDDFFGRGRRGVYKRFVVPSNPLTLEVLALPTEGRPANFAGHVGRYQIEAAATPTVANVGDPITLTIRLSGPEFLRDVELPPLKDQPALARDFKIPEERASGKLDGKAKVFTQTIRARRATISEIPPIELPYFDTASGRYRVARTVPIPLAIRNTRVVTAGDAEGRELAPARSELAAWGKGIAHNYDDLSVLADQQYGLATLLRSPLWGAATFGPFGAYVILLAATTVVRRARADPESREARKAHARLRRTLKHIASRGAGPAASGEVLEALREYLGRKLRRPASSLTYRDVEAPLRQRGLDEETLAETKALFEACEAGHYAGPGNESQGDGPVAARALALADSLEKALK